jgi:hypothetical protein
MITIEPNFYVALWNKYRPVILQLMTAATNGPQKYQLFVHEFKATGVKEKSGYTFTLEAANGKARNNIRDSAVARDLLAVLQQSPRASALMSEAVYAFSLDKQFVLHVDRKETIAQEA